MAGYDDFYELARPVSPAAGAPFLFRVPGESWFRITAVRFTLTTSAVVANRFATVDYLDGDQGAFLRSMSGTALAASLTRTFNFAPEYATPTVSVGGDEMAPLSTQWLPPGYRIRITAINLDAADQVGGVSLYMCRAMTGKVGEPEYARPWSE